MQSKLDIPSKVETKACQLRRKSANSSKDSSRISRAWPKSRLRRSRKRKDSAANGTNTRTSFWRRETKSQNNSIAAIIGIASCLHRPAGDPRSSCQPMPPRLSTATPKHQICTCRREAATCNNFKLLRSRMCLARSRVPPQTRRQKFICSRSSRTRAASTSTWNASRKEVSSVCWLTWGQRSMMEKSISIRGCNMIQNGE